MKICQPSFQYAQIHVSWTEPVITQTEEQYDFDNGSIKNIVKNVKREHAETGYLVLF